MQNDSYTIQFDPENPTFPFNWLPLLMVAGPILAVVIAAVLFWAKRRSRRRPPT